MSTGVAGFSRHSHFAELLDMLVTNEGVKSSAERQHIARQNLGVDEVVTLTDANATISANNSGKTHVVPNVSADRTFTLPAGADGLDFLFVAQVGAADGHDWIFATDDAAELFAGGVLMVDTDAGPATVAVVKPDQSNDDAFQVNLPQGGTWVRFTWDGTFWVVSGTITSTAAAVFS